MKYFDVHCHVFPDSVAPKVVASLESYYHEPWRRTGTVADLHESLEDAHIDKAVFLASATRPDQVRNLNNYLASLLGPKVICLGSLHPDYTDLKGELARMKEIGLTGLKFHPDFQKLYIDEPRMMRLYELIPPEMPILFHVGDVKSDYSSPKRLANVLDRFPHLKNIIAAHMGGYSVWNDSWKHLVGRDVWFDTSSTFFKLPPHEVTRMILAHGVDRVLWATDYPALSHRDGIAEARTLDLTEEQFEKIFYKNAERLFGVTL